METKSLPYTCPYCNKGHETPGGLACCILSCEDRIKKEKEEARRAQILAEKEARYKEVIGAYENFEELRSKYVDDYGSFTFKHKSDDDELYDWVLGRSEYFNEVTI